MKKSRRTIALQSILLFYSAVFLSACENTSAPEPTQDMSAFSTSIVQTVAAEYPVSADIQTTAVPEQKESGETLSTVNMSSVVVLPITPSAGEELPVNPYTVPTAGAEDQMIVRNDSLPIITPEAAGAIPTAFVPTATRAASGKGDKAAYDTQSPLDGAHVERGSEFDVIWYLINTGTTTWTTDYCLRYFTGTDLTKPGKTRYYLSEPVEPGATGKCIVDALAPEEPGTYKMSVVLGNENDENFFIVDITIVVD